MTNLIRSSLRSFLVVTAALTALVGLAGCKRPVHVSFDPSGAQKIQALGEVGVSGKLGRGIIAGGREFPEGTRVVVSETFLIRQEGGDPPAYRVGGLYDPAKRSQGFVLPAGAIEVIFYSYVEDQPRSFVPVPQEYFVRAP